MKTCLRLSSLLLFSWLLSCNNPYKNLIKENAPSFSALSYKPEYDKALYRCHVNGKFLFKKFHLSGLLFFKKTTTTTHVVFQNEMGISFFDFEWDAQDRFKVNQIIPQLDKPAVIKILRKDLQLFLMIGLNEKTEQQFQKDGFTYNRFDMEKGNAYYLFKDHHLTTIEAAGKTKVTTITLGAKATKKSLPETSLFKHHKANFTIELQKIETNADE